MSYLKDFKSRIESDDYASFLQLWEEYCEIDEVDGEELSQILTLIQQSRFAPRFGDYAGSALHLWQKVVDPEGAWKVLRLILDLETGNSPELADITFRALQERYGDDQYFHEKIRLIGLRGRDKFQGAIRNYELLSHLDKGAFVYHTGGWGTGEVMEFSLIREELVLEFEGVAGLRSVPFENAFANLAPLTKDHFLAQRFGDPDRMEEEARRDPVPVIRLLLRDLGPKTAAEIKEELSDLVIPSDEWTKWWQSARARIKRDTMIETPPSVRQPFRLRLEEVSHGERLTDRLESLRDPAKVALTIYNFVRDFPEVMREEQSAALIRERLIDLGQDEGLSDPITLTVAVLIEELLSDAGEGGIQRRLATVDNVVDAIDQMEIPAYKKRVLAAIRESRDDWVDLFLEALFRMQQSMLRDYLLRELKGEERLIEKIVELLEAPERHPSLFYWYFQKVVGGDDLPYGNEKEAQCDFFEGYLTLFHRLERIDGDRDLVKKMYNLFCNDRYRIVRDVLEGSSVAFAQEFLLLVTKVASLTDHDIKIMHSLAAVAHPSLGRGSEREQEEIIWTTEEGYHRVQERIRELGTVEAVKNAREVEEARSHGDLRENADYKGALERRQRIQAEMKQLSDQVRQARILSEGDVPEDKVGIGSVVDLVNDKGEKKKYTLLGPWEADPDHGVLSLQSRFAQSLCGHQVGDTISYQNETFTVEKIGSFFDG